MQTTEQMLIPVTHDDLVRSWKALELLVHALHRIGSHYSLPSEAAVQTEQDRREMLSEIDGAISPELFRELSRARVTLGRYLPDDEAETISDSLDYYQPKGPSSKRNA